MQENHFEMTLENLRAGKMKRLFFELYYSVVDSPALAQVGQSGQWFGQSGQWFGQSGQWFLLLS